VRARVGERKQPDVRVLLLPLRVRRGALVVRFRPGQRGLGVPGADDDLVPQCGETSGEGASTDPVPRTLSFTWVPPVAAYAADARTSSPVDVKMGVRRPCVIEP